MQSEGLNSPLSPVVYGDIALSINTLILTINTNTTYHYLQVGFTLQTSRTKNKRVISTFKLGYPSLTLKERPKVKSDHIRRIHTFLKVAFTLQTFGTNSKQVISTFA